MSADTNNSNFSKIKYPFTILSIATVVTTLLAVLYYAKKDTRLTINEEKRYDTQLISSYQKYYAKDTSRNSFRMNSSIEVLLGMKSNALDDATEFYEGTYIFAHLLGICSILASILILFLINSGWRDADPDIKASVFILFMVCSISYLIPRLMNNEKNYGDTRSIFYTCKRQVIYSTKIFSAFYCSDTPANRIQILTEAADSNFSVIQANIDMHYDMNTGEATKHFEELQQSVKELHKNH